ncbi:MAG: pentapeptide repeat-containing protein [Myxococcales bacterium]|nr:pentapeptide repeat-containing protein [Myxococcales bacterium]
MTTEPTPPSSTPPSDGRPPPATMIGHAPQPGFTPAGPPSPGGFVPAGQPLAQPGGFVPAGQPLAQPGGFIPAGQPLAPPGNFVHTAPQPDPGPAYPPPSSPPPPARPPVPSASPSLRPSRNPIVRLVLWFTEPSMIKGMALGVVLALVLSVAVKLESMWFIVSSMVTLVVTCLFGVLIGNYLFERRRKRLQARGMAMLREAGGELPGLSHQLMHMVLQRDTSALPNVWEHLRRIRPAAEEIAGLSVAAVFRVMAMSTLFAVLGGAISFAVFLTSYMQVERMDAQNQLIAQQIEQTSQQMKQSDKQTQIAVALSIAERRQATAREIIGVINGDRSTTQDGKRALTPATANLVAIAFSQLSPYRGVRADITTGDNNLTDEVRSPEQEQLMRYLAALNIDFGDIDLSSAYLAHAQLPGLDLARAQLPRVSLRSATIYDARLSGANLVAADFTLGVLARSDFTAANLTSAVLHRANLTDAVLSEANLTDADLSGAILKKAVFKQTQLARALLHGANLAQCDLTSADISEADLALAELEAATLPAVPKVRAAGFWWLGIYAPDYAAKLGLDAAAQQRNRDALTRLRAAPDAPAVAAVVQELKTAVPAPPA